MKRIALTVLLCAHLFVRADEHDHIYKDGEEVSALEYIKMRRGEGIIINK